MKPVIIVEGTSDINKLRNLVDADFVATNGSSVSRETIEYIKRLSIDRTIILLLDPDYPGMRIRRILQKEIPDAKNAYVRKELSIKGKKLGVCECDDQEIMRALNEIYNWDFKVDDEKFNFLKSIDLLNLGLIGECSVKKRDYLSRIIPIGKANGKTLLKRLNQLRISKEQLIDYLKEFKNDC